MPGKLGSYEIEEYEVTLPSGETVTRKRVKYIDFQNKEISTVQYTDQTIIDSGYVDNSDPTIAVNQMSFTYDASEDWNGCEGVTNRFIKRAGGNYTNITPYVAWVDCALVGIAISSREPQEWSAVIYINGDEEIARLDSEGNRFACGKSEHKIAAGTPISIYVDGENIQNPGVQLIFTAILPPKISDKN